MWLKLKTHLPTLDCVVTAAEYGHGKRRNSLSDYTFAVWRGDPAAGDGAELVNIGKAYSGVTDAEIAELTKLFKSIAIADNGRVFQVRPQVVMEIAFDQIQRSARHASGYALRFPRIKNLRWDKRPEVADRVERVEEIYQSAANTSRDAGTIEEDEGRVAAGTKAPRRKSRKRAAPEPTLFDDLP
jgi:DNA ligase-1